jgi:hypothetical protein
MDVEARAGGEPATDLGMLVGGVVVDDQVDVERLGDGSLDVAEELQELLVAMPALALREHLARGDVERREQRRGAVMDVVVGDAFDVADAQRQQRLRAVEGLDLALLVDAQDDRVVGRVQVQPTMSRTFSTKKGSVEILKCFWRWGWRWTRLSGAAARARSPDGDRSSRRATCARFTRDASDGSAPGRQGSAREACR